MTEPSGSICSVDRCELRCRVSRYWFWTAQFFALLSVSLIAALSTYGQTSPPQRVYGSTTTRSSTIPTDVAGFSKDSTTGALTAIMSSPFPERLEGGAMAVDGQGKFLFVMNPKSNDISLFQIDQTSGALSEVPGSPFAFPALVTGIPAPTGLLSIATERSGQFLFASYYYYAGTNTPGAVVSFAIDTSVPSNPVLRPIELDYLVAVPPSTQVGTAIQMLTDAKGIHLYVGTGVGPPVGPGLSNVSGGALVYAIQSTGHLVFQGAAASLPSNGTAYAIDPLDRFFYGVGGDVPFIIPCIISPVDGTATNCASAGTPQHLGFTNNQFGMQIESSGHFLYIAAVSDLAVFSIDQTTGVPTQVSTITGILSGNGAPFITDPLGPYLYTAAFLASPSAIHTYQVNRSTGNLTEIPGSPVTMTVPCCQSLAITGNLPLVNGPGVSIFPSSAAPFSATVGGSSAVQAFSVVNIGNQTLTFTSISIAGTGASSFSTTNTCSAPLAPNANCSVSITFSPASAGTFTARLQVADNAADSPQTLALSGTAVAPVPSVVLSTGSLSFSQIAQGATEGPLPVTVTSNGTGPLHVSSVTFSGPNPNDFSQTNTCVGTPVAVNATCTINVSFTPIAPGGRTATLDINDDVLGSPQPVALSGTAVAAAPSVSLTPSSLSFSQIVQGATEGPLAITVMNTGNSPLHVTSVTLGGPQSFDFSQTNTCVGAAVAANGTCTINVSFTPSAVGTRSATLSINDDAAGSPQTASLSGTAVAGVPSVSLNPNSLSFTPPIAQGGTEGPLAVTVTNNGTGPLHVSGVTLGGSNPNDFSQTNTCVGTPVAVSKSCAINVSFAPTATGGRTATLTINDDASGGTQSVSLQATATAPFQLGPGASSTGTSATVTAGQTAQYSLQLAPGAGFTGSVALACSGAPTLATCTVSPTALNITNANAAPFTVSVTTTGSAAVPMSIRNKPFANWRLYPAIAAWLIFLLILRMNETKLIARRFSYVAAASAFAVLLTASGCGGGSTAITPPPTQVTPKGTYTLTVTATANNLPAQTISLTLTVN